MRSSNRNLSRWSKRDEQKYASSRVLFTSRLSSACPLFLFFFLRLLLQYSFVISVFSLCLSYRCMRGRRECENVFSGGLFYILGSQSLTAPPSLSIWPAVFCFVLFLELFVSRHVPHALLVSLLKIVVTSNLVSSPQWRAKTIHLICKSSF
jgi:hypothetical protein